MQDNYLEKWEGEVEKLIGYGRIKYLRFYGSNQSVFKVILVDGSSQVPLSLLISRQYRLLFHFHRTKPTVSIIG